MSGRVPVVPEGFIPRAWASYPTLHGLWRPSKVHLAPVSELRGGRYVFTLCGARKGRGVRASDPASIGDHMEDAGQCKRCLSIAGVLGGGGS